MFVYFSKLQGNVTNIVQYNVAAGDCLARDRLPATPDNIYT